VIGADDAALAVVLATVGGEGGMACSALHASATTQSPNINWRIRRPMVALSARDVYDGRQ
jgi:hypothetical protein